MNATHTAFKSTKSNVTHKRVNREAPLRIRQSDDLLERIHAACRAWDIPFDTLRDRLFVSPPNAKLILTGTFSFALPAAFGCPGAAACLTPCLAMKGHYGVFNVQQPRIENLLWIHRHGWNAWADAMIEVLTTRRGPAVIGMMRFDQPQIVAIETFRWHDSGDWLNQEHLDAAVRVMRACPHIRFYSYTKSLHLDWTDALTLPNYNRIQSFGGRYDKRIDLSLPHAIMVTTLEDLEAAEAEGYVYGSDSELPAINGEQRIVLMEIDRKRFLKNKKGLTK